MDLSLFFFQGLFLLILHFIFDFVLTAMHYIDQRHKVPSNGWEKDTCENIYCNNKPSSNMLSPLPKRKMSIVEKIGWFLANSASSIAVMISLFFWLFLYQVSVLTSVLIISQHCPSPHHRQHWRKNCSQHNNSSLCYNAPLAKVSSRDKLTFHFFIQPNTIMHNTTFTQDCYYSINATESYSDYSCSSENSTQLI